MLAIVAKAATYRFSTLVVFLCLIPITLFSQISLSNETSGPGTSVLMPVLFSPQENTVVSGVQFDLGYNSAVMNVTAVAGDAARKANKNVYSSDPAPNIKRFLIVSLNENPIPAGTLLNLFINLTPGAPADAYTLTISNVVESDPNGQPAPSTSAGGSITIQGTNGSRLQPAGVLNAASLLGGPVAPGEVVTLIGAGIGPASALQPGSSSSGILGETSVMFDGRSAPLLYASPNQINAIVPYEVAGQTNTQVSVSSAGELVAGFSLPVATVAPAIFTLDASGAGPGAILNQDATVNSPTNPAGRGSVVVLFGTGIGQTDAPSNDGEVTPEVLPHSALLVSAQIGGMEAEVLYAGGAPGLIAGVFQVNCKVPENIAPGPSVPVILTVGGIASPPGVTLAVAAP